MTGKFDIEKLDRFRKGLSDRTEKKYIYSLFSENKEIKDLKQHLFAEFDKYMQNNPEEDYQLSHLLDRVHHIIHKRANHKERAFTKKAYKWFALAAAALLIPLLIAGVFSLTAQRWEKGFFAEAPAISKLYAPMGARISFSLPDGSKGWLNSGSSLEYSVPFIQNRQVAVSGEAWLDVAPDKNHPFEINAGNAKIKVLGTKFNINAYPEENHIEVILEEGKVEFSMPGLESDIEMKPSERLVFREGTVSVGFTDVTKYSAWTDGKLVFRTDPMIEVVRRIERWYNVEIELVDKDLERDLISGTFQDDSLEDVIRYLSLTSPIRYKILDPKVNTDGVVQKPKVLLYREKPYQF